MCHLGTGRSRSAWHSSVHAGVSSSASGPEIVTGELREAAGGSSRGPERHGERPMARPRPASPSAGPSGRPNKIQYTMTMIRSDGVNHSLVSRARVIMAVSFRINTSATNNAGHRGGRPENAGSAVRRCPSRSAHKRRRTRKNELGRSEGDRVAVGRPRLLT